MYQIIKIKENFLNFQLKKIFKQKKSRIDLKK